MTRWTWMMVRVYAPAAGLLAMALMLVVVASRIRQSPFLSAFDSALQWATGATLLASFAAAVVGSVALWRWEQGRTHVCACGGMLGFEREGRWGPFKRCLACGRTQKLAL